MCAIAHPAIAQTALVGDSGLSRMYNNVHWASDVALAAAIGTFSGIEVVRYSHGHSDNLVDRWLLGLEATPLGDARVALGWSQLPILKSRLASARR